MFKKLTNLIGYVIEKLGSLSSFFIIILIILVSASVILRYVFSIGFIWLQDLYIWAHAFFILLGIAYTLKSDKHVRIDLIYRELPEKKKKKINFLGSVFFGLPFCFILITVGFEYFYRSFDLNEGSKESGGLENIFILKFFIFFLGFLLFLELTRQIIKFIIKND